MNAISTETRLDILEREINGTAYEAFFYIGERIAERILGPRQRNGQRKLEHDNDRPRSLPPPLESPPAEVIPAYDPDLSAALQRVVTLHHGIETMRAEFSTLARGESSELTVSFSIPRFTLDLSSKLEAGKYSSSIAFRFQDPQDM